MATTPSATGALDPVWPEDAVEVGYVLGAWGVKGWIKVQPFASDPQALFSSRRWFIRPAEDASKRPGAKPASEGSTLLKIAHAKEHGDVIVAQVHEIEDRDGAEALRGARIFVGRSSFPTADPDEFYWVDLIGLAVWNREGELLGTVVGLIDTGPHSVLRIQPTDADGEERLVPFVAAYVDDVSLTDKRITVDWGPDY